MSIPYQVTYRNLWPKEMLNDRIKQNLAELESRASGVADCAATLTPMGQGLELRLNLRTGGRRGFGQTIFRCNDDNALMQAVDSAFDQAVRALRTAVSGVTLGRNPS